MNAPGAGTATAARSVPGWRTLAVFALLAPALVIAIGSPVVTLATIAGFVLGKSARELRIGRLRRTVDSARALLASAAFGPAATDFQPVEEGLE